MFIKKTIKYIIPNTITLLRFLYVILLFFHLYNNIFQIINFDFSFIFLFDEKFYNFIISFIFFYLSDILDGYIAKKTSSQSFFGMIFDHITDKIFELLSISYFILVTFQNNIFHIIFLLFSLVYIIFTFIFINHIKNYLDYMKKSKILFEIYFFNKIFLLFFIIFYSEYILPFILYIINIIIINIIINKK